MSSIQETIKLGGHYSKKDLAVLLNEPTLVHVREGVFSCKNSDAYLLFVDLEKGRKEERFHFSDYFEGDFFHWDTQTTQNINSPKIQDVINGRLVPHLFVRLKQKAKSTTLPFIYCGRLTFIEHESGTANPAHIIFQNDDFSDESINPDLIAVYNWKPAKVGKENKSKVSKAGQISEKRKRMYSPPNATERKGIVTSRVGQGYYRQQIIEKWNGQCAVTGSNLLTTLIASHIVRWSECDDTERLDVENGILLSPLYDALFDKYLISFEDDGSVIFSSLLTDDEKLALNVTENIQINVSQGMEPYLKRHRAKLK